MTYKNNNNKIIENSLLMRDIAKAYHRNKLFLFEAENGFKKCSTKEIENAYMIVYRVDYIIDKILDKDDSFIIKKEVIERQDTSWHKEYMSDSKYYKNRRKAYANFIKELNS